MSGLYFPPVIVNGRINFPNPLFQTYGAHQTAVVWRPFMPGVVNPLNSNIVYTGNMISPTIHNLRPVFGNSTSLGNNLPLNLHSLTNPLSTTAVGLQSSLFTCSPHVGMSLEIKKDVSGEKRKIEDDSEHRDRKKVKLETKALKAKRPGFTEERYNETSYYEDSGLRKVYPYYFTFTTFCKGRWVGQPILEIFAREFRAHPPEEYERCIKSGTLTVNYKTVDIDYKLQHNDLLANTVHRHEVPVATFPIEILHESDDLVVIDKPPSIPVHPCGRYRHNTVVFILAKEFNLKNLRTIHRLDRLTSGLLLFGRSLKKARQLEHEIRSRLVQKQYVCRVVGEFPTEKITCEEPIEVVSYKIGVCRVGANGKECKTEFERLSFNGTSSVVLCKPRTGRMHQIRVHLQFLGYPIVNDPLYNHTVFGPEKGKGGRMDKTNEELITELIRIHNAENWLGLDGDDSESFLSPKIDSFIPSEDADSKIRREETAASPVVSSDPAIDISTTENTTHKADEPNSSDNDSDKVKTKLQPMDPSKFEKDANCYECRVKYRDPSPKDLVMYLHAWRYQGPDWGFETKLPKWAGEDWKEPSEIQ